MDVNVDTSVVLGKDLVTELSNVEVTRSKLYRVFLMMILLCMNLMNGYNGL